MVTVHFINEDGIPWKCANGCGYSAPLPEGYSRHEFEPNGEAFFVCGPVGSEFPYGTTNILVDGRTYFLYARITEGVTNIREFSF